MLGHQLLLPIPDVDRTQFLLVLGANPLVSNGSIMTAPGIGRRLEALRARGGRLVVVDPRRSETAAVADEHLFIRPGGDAYLLAGMLHTIFADGRARLGRLGPLVDGLDVVEKLAARFSPARVAARTGIAAERIEKLARDFAAAPSAVCYGRVGVCTQEFGGLAAWLINILNIVTGNFDRQGGAMLTTPAADLVGLATRLGERGHFGVWKSRVRGLPEFGGELPVATLAEEIETPGDGQIRALVTHAGNPVLSTPNGARLSRALAGLDFMVAIDIYRNETTRHAHLILPTSFGLERDHYDLAFYALAVRNVARWVPPALTPPPGVRHDWQVLFDLALGVHAAGGGRRDGKLVWLMRAMRLFGPRRLLDLLLRFGPHKLSLQTARRPSRTGSISGRSSRACRRCWRRRTGASRWRRRRSSTISGASRRSSTPRRRRRRRATASSCSSAAGSCAATTRGCTTASGSSRAPRRARSSCTPTTRAPAASPTASASRCARASAPSPCRCRCRRTSPSASSACRTAGATAATASPCAWRRAAPARASTI